MSESEQWRAIPKCPAYEISNRGRVRKIIYKAYYLNQWGYPCVQLWKGNARYQTATIHRLVAEAFVPNPNSLPEVNHKDGNKLNFDSENLEWMTRFDNQRHMMKLHLRREARGEDHGNAKLTEEQVKEILTLDGKMNQRDIAAKFGISQYVISKIMLGKLWRHIPREGPQPNRKLFPNRSRFKNGNRHPLAKLTETDVRTIRASKDSRKKLAQQFGVSDVTITKIITRKSWRHVI